MKREVLEITDRIFSLIRHGRHRKRRFQKYFYCVCIRCRGNNCTKPFHNNHKGLDIQTQRPMGGFYEVRR
jgi:hypothetical protein